MRSNGWQGGKYDLVWRSLESDLQMEKELQEWALAKKEVSGKRRALMNKEVIAC